MGPSRARPPPAGFEGAAQLEGEPDAGPAAGHVVVQVAVQPLELRVEVGGQGDEQDLGVERGQVEGPGHPPEAKVRTGGLGAVGGGLDRGQQLVGRQQLVGGARLSGGSVGEERQPGAGEQPVDLRVGGVQAPEAVARVRVVAAPPPHRHPDALLQHRQPSQQMRDRRVAGQCLVCLLPVCVSLEG